MFSGTLRAPKTGEYVFEIASDDVVRLLVDGKTVVEHKGAGYLGIQSGEGEGGVRIVRTVDGSPARESGLLENDVLLAVDGKPFTDPGEFRKKIGSHHPGDEVELSYRRADKEARVRVKLA
ncbi:MAG: PDZ domain-containing protein, partial [Akkermansiaceae bacterium]|nr:PDZ domain-containing protein [Akkermansiaceae bacterium]